MSLSEDNKGRSKFYSTILGTFKDALLADFVNVLFVTGGSLLTSFYDLLDVVILGGTYSLISSRSVVLIYGKVFLVSLSN